jgi:NADH pyrophosphatase NudC (nudix superfamily)
MIYASGLSEAIRKLQYVNFNYWDEKIKYCPKCYKEVHGSVCEHDWEPANDDGNAPLYNGIKPVRVAICSKCGTAKYKVSGKLSPSTLY